MRAGILKIFKRGAKPEGEQVEETRSSITQATGEPLILGFLSGKGGCGKSTISVNTAILLSALSNKGEGVLAIDMDITNATLTNMLLSVTPDILKEDDGVSTIDYITEGAEKYVFYKLEFPPNKVFNIQVSGRKDLGVPVKDLYVLPAKKATVSYEQRLSALAHLTQEEIRDSLLELFNSARKFAKERNVKYIIFDFPPFRPDQRKVYEGVFALVEYIPNFVMVCSFDYAAVHGLIGVLDRRYSYLKTRTLGFLINMAVLEDEKTVESIRRYIETIYGKGVVHFIRSDPRWRINFLPPIILGDPGEGAHYDLISAYAKIGILDREGVVKKLNIKL